MPFNGSGGFIPLAAPIFPAVPNTTIVSSYYNQNLTDLFGGFGNCVTRDGQSPATANLPMGGFKHTGAAVATGAGEYLTYGQGQPATTFADGTAALPGVAFTAESGMGMFRLSAGVLGLSTAGAQRVWVNSTGVGIGITPSFKLDVRTSTGTIGYFRDTTLGYYSAFRTDTNGPILEFGNGITGFRIADGTTDRLWISTSGNVGIGIPPTQRFHVAGAGNPVSAITSTDASGATGYIQAIGSASVNFGSLGSHPVNITTAALNRITIDTSGRVGIGQTPAGEILEISRAISIHGSLQTATGPKLALDYAANVSRFLAFGSVVGTTGTFEFYQASSNNSVNRTAMSIGTTGILNIGFGQGGLTLGGNVTRAEAVGTPVAINSAFAQTTPRRPDTTRVFLECVTTELGYAVGQCVEWPPSRVGYTGGWWAFSNAANTNWTVQTFNATIQLPNTAGVATNITPANWNIRTALLFL